jgi:hypothetical protein
VLAVDPADSQLPAPSATAQRMNPSILTAKTLRTTQTRQHDRPMKDDPFTDADGPYVWSEFNHTNIPNNPSQAKVDLSRPNVLWYYLGKTSTEAKAQYTEDPRRPRNNPESIFLESKKPGYRPPTKYPQVSGPGAPSNSSGASQPPASQAAAKQYEYKPKNHAPYNVDSQSLLMQQRFLQQSGGYQGNSTQGQPPQSGGTAQPRPAADGSAGQLQPPVGGVARPNHSSPKQQAPTANMGNSISTPAPTAPMTSPASVPAMNRAGSGSTNPKTPNKNHSKNNVTARTNSQTSAPVANMGTATNPIVRAGTSSGTNGLSSLSSIYNPQTGSYRSPYAATYQANGGYKSPYAVGGGFANGYQPKLQQLQQQTPPPQQQRQRQQASQQVEPRRLSSGPYNSGQGGSPASGENSVDPLLQQRPQQQQQQQQPQQPRQPELHRWSQPQNQGKFMQHQYNVATAQASAEMAK